MRNPSVPFRPNRRRHTASELLPARIGIREVLDEVLGRLFVSLFRDDNVGLSCVSTFGSVHPSYLFDQIRTRGSLFSATASPRALEHITVKKMHEAIGICEPTQPASVVSTSLGASSSITRCFSTEKSYTKPLRNRTQYPNGITHLDDVIPRKCHSH